MSQPVADRNLLFGVLAMQMDFITREQLITAMQAWVFDKSKPLGEILKSQQALADDNRQLLEALVAKHLAMHDNNAEKSLAAVSSIASVKKDLEKIADQDVQASLVHVSTARPKDEDIYKTVAPSKIGSGTGMRFRIVRPHAKGGLGEVWIAHDEELHREVALKEIQQHQADNLESRSRFMIEAEITGGLEHPGIVPVYGLGTYGDGRPYYAMRFIRGDSLKDAIERFHKADKAGLDAGTRTLELRRLLGRFVDVCNAISYAHSRGILHRDLKPGNIMLGKYGETLVVDWGLAKPMGQPFEKTERIDPGEGSLIPHSISGSAATLMGSALGTPQYMSPEQAAGRQDQLGPASDVYSLGATLYCVLTGQAPFSEKDVGTVLQKVQRGEFPTPREVKANVPLPLEAICKKAMALMPGNRYATPAALANDIEHWLADEPVSAWPEPWTVTARRWVGRHTALVTGAASAVMIALVALIVSTVLLNAANERERQAKRKAEENYQLARSAVHRYLTEVNDNDALKEPGMEPLKKKLLEAAQEYNQKFVELRRDDPTVKVELAQATHRLGKITAELDSELAALKLQEEAAKMLEALPADSAGDIRGDLAACYHHLGQLNWHADRITASEKWYQAALAIWDQLIKDQPKEARFRDGQARTQLGLGNVFQYTSKLAPAQKSYESAIEIWDALHKADPKSASFRRDLAIAHNNLGMVLMRRPGKEADAKKALRAAEQLQQQLVAEAPKLLLYQSDLAKTEFNLGEYKEAARRLQTLVDRHRAVTHPHRTLAEALTSMVNVYFRENAPDKAEDAADKAVAMKRKIAEQRAGVPRYQGDLARGLSTLGAICEARGKFKPAASAYDEAIAIQEKLARDISEVPHYRRDVAACYHGRGRVYARQQEMDKAMEAFRKSIAGWDKLIKDHGNDRDYTIGLFRACYDMGSAVHAGPTPKDAIVWYKRAEEVAPDDKAKAAVQKRMSALATP